MSNLFSAFDPSTNIFNISLNWISTFIGMMMIPSMFWLTSSRSVQVWNKINSTLHKELKVLIGNKSPNGKTMLFISMMIMFMMNNFMGLFPYIFTSSSHFMMTFSIALPMWVSFMLFGWINNTKHMFTHLVPLNTPTPLMSFMVLIETISNLIRPGTLTVRMTANMIAGHLLLTLMGNTGSVMSTSLILIILTSQILLLSLESMVALIQAYVFSILSILYSKETY
uniref:ATP synthase subunit a n=1 Tax=Physemacris variolosa TaxID=62778 RepID=E0YCJ1_9ORTH|nr:ATP synthase F0 subunit 6 [Physemacris variolosa]ADD97026.1 ATP synthase F0 subunit 6 [Physemacris variolosa]